MTRSQETAGEARPSVVLYADGACSGNPGPGGWGAILVDVATGRELEMSGAEARTTNNRMELTGVLEGLRRLKQPSRVKVVTDSRYVADGMSRWIHSWIRNGWKTSDRKPVKNQELWQALILQTEIHDVSFEWTAGHAGHDGNERCDRLAVNAYHRLIDRGGGGES